MADFSSNGNLDMAEVMCLDRPPCLVAAGLTWNRRERLESAAGGEIVDPTGCLVVCPSRRIRCATRRITMKFTRVAGRAFSGGKVSRINSVISAVTSTIPGSLASWIVQLSI